MLYSKVKDWDSACIVAAEIPFGTEQKCEGTEAETFLAGWCNAADMIEDKELDENDTAEVLRYVFAEFNNMGYKA